MTTDEQAAMRGMSVARVRRNYWLCDAQLAILRARATDATDTRDDESARTLNTWQASYLAELVRRGERI